ncbi:SIR2 family protein [Priestia megaterium]|uniref:SIR2 family protein n=1 Tax=Priestia megaterium TaxID=1404 RepID=UPI0011BBEB3D|nr:SIR2 family protein [Priestia megaterium]QDZ80161.1 hypothetical protein D0440_12190 [Priestia megaterium]
MEIKKNLNIEAILEAINKDNLVVFIGAGVSANSTLPSWSDLIKKFAQGLGMSRDLTTDDYLRIPQYYYNQRGMKEYYQKINDIFNVKLTPNIIHDRILELKPKHIITTNYDNLIEQAIEKHLLFYDLVCEDLDLPYTSNGRLLIKMHGDLDRKNIVLKEDDYLNYSTNFKLIESYIKSIFVNNTVVFIGYSLQDYDLKLILKSLQGILGEHFQKAYLIDSDEIIKSTVEKEYFMNLGVNVIDIADLPDSYKKLEIEELESDKGKNIVRILNYINVYNNINYNVLDFYYNKLLLFKDLQKVRIKDIVLKLGIEGSYRLEKGNLFRVDRLNKNSKFNDILLLLKDIQVNLNTHSYDVRKKYEFINTAFLKAGILQVEIGPSGDDSIIYKVDTSCKDKEPSIINNLLMNNYMEIELLAKQYYKTINEFKGTYANELMRAYGNYLMNRFVSAYEILKKISIEAYREKNYVTFYIIEFNKRYLIKKLKYIQVYPSIRNDMSEEVYLDYIRSLIKEYETSNINLEEAFEFLSKKEKESIRFLHDLVQEQGYILQKLNRVQKLKDKVGEEVNTSYYGVDPVAGALNDLIVDAYEFWDYSNYNFIMLDHYSEVKEYYYYFVDSLLNTYSKEKEELGKGELDSFFGDGANLMPNYIFNLKDINIICRYLNWKKINELFVKYDIDNVEVSISSVIIKGCFINIVNSYGKTKHVRNLKEMMNNMFLFLSKVKIDKQDFDDIIVSLIKLLSSNYINSELYSGLLHFIKGQAIFGNVTSETINNLTLCFINKVLDTEYNTHRGGHEVSALSEYNYIKELVTSVELKEELNVGVNEINKLLDSIQFGELRNKKQDIIFDIFMPLSLHLSNELKELIKNYIIENLNQRFSIKQYSIACLNRAINPSNELEQKSYEQVTELKKSQGKSPVKVSPDPLQENLSYLIRLLLDDKILNKERFQDFIGINNLYDFLILKENYNFENVFELEWLTYLNNKELKKMFNHEKVIKGLKEKFISEIIKNDLSKELKAIYFQHFG